MSLNLYQLRVEMRGWGEKSATFWATEEGAKALCDALKSVFREGAMAYVMALPSDSTSQLAAKGSEIIHSTM